jgi:methylmalonyl-CoA mutase
LASLQRRNATRYFLLFVRGKEIKVETKYESLSHLKIPKISLPKFQDWGDLIRWKGQENVPSVSLHREFILSKELVKILQECLQEKEAQKEPTEDFYVSQKCLRKDFLQRLILLHFTDKILLPPDIYGKIGNAGVSIATLDDAKKLYSGFDLINALTSVSMTINGPAPMFLAFFMNTAIDQNVEKYINQVERL